MKEECIRRLRGLHEETEYSVRGREENSNSWRPLRGLREGCATSPILFNIYHSAAIRQAAEDRTKSAHEKGLKVGIELSWRPGNSLPPKSTLRAIKSVERVMFRLTEPLFADETTSYVEKDEMVHGKKLLTAA